MTADEFYAIYRSYLGDKYEGYGFESLVPVTVENAADTYRTLSSLGSTSASARRTAVP